MKLEEINKSIEEEKKKSMKFREKLFIFIRSVIVYYKIVFYKNKKKIFLFIYYICLNNFVGKNFFFKKSVNKFLGSCFKSTVFIDLKLMIILVSVSEFSEFVFNLFIFILFCEENMKLLLLEFRVKMLRFNFFLT